MNTDTVPYTATIPTCEDALRALLAEVESLIVQSDANALDLMAIARRGYGLGATLDNARVALSLKVQS